MTRRSRLLRGRGLPWGVLVLAVLVGVLLAPVAANAAGIGFTAQPLPGSPGAELGYFKFDAAPGASVSRVLLITNTSKKAQSLRVVSNDGRASVYGGVDYADIGATSAAVGTWIAVSSPTVKLPPGASAKVPFVVTVPSDVTSGEHVGGLSVWEPSATTRSATAAAANQAGTRILYVERRVLAVEVVTPGPAVPEIIISGVKATPRPDGMYLSIAIANNGTAAATGNGELALSGSGFSDKFSLDTMIPAAKTDYPVKWKRNPSEGTYPATVQIHYADDTKVATWSGNVTVGSAEAKKLGERLVGPAEPGGSSKTPWLMYGLIGGLVVIVLIMGFALLRRRRPETR